MIADLTDVLILYLQRIPRLGDIVANMDSRLDVEVEASGFGNEFGESVNDVSPSAVLELVVASINTE